MIISENPNHKTVFLKDKKTGEIKNVIIIDVTKTYKPDDKNLVVEAPKGDNEKRLMVAKFSKFDMTKLDPVTGLVKDEFLAENKSEA